MKSSPRLVAILAASPVHAAWKNASFTRVPSEFLYLLPHPFDSEIQYGWLNKTTTNNATINHVLGQANQARIVSYSDEFTDMVGPNPTWSKIDSPPNDRYGAYEGGAWIPETDEVWVTITSFNLRDGTSKQIVTDPPISYPYGMYYWPPDGQVYVTEINTPTDPASVISIDPKTLKVTPIFNSYQGLPLAPCDNAGRVWTAEDDGIIVRSPQGVTLGSFNYIPFHPVDSPVIANFALAGNRLVIGVNGFVVIYNISGTLTSPENLLTN